MRCVPLELESVEPRKRIDYRMSQTWRQLGIPNIMSSEKVMVREYELKDTCTHFYGPGKLWGPSKEIIKQLPYR